MSGHIFLTLCLSGALVYRISYSLAARAEGPSIERKREREREVEKERERERVRDTVGLDGPMTTDSTGLEVSYIQ